MRTPVVLLMAVSCTLAQVTLTTDSVILIDRREPVPLQKAARDLASDLGKVLGKPVRVVHEPVAGAPSTIRVVWNGAQRPAGWEVLSIQAVPGGVVLTGSDLRGAIYAVYHFAETFLGVDPLSYWTDHDPPRQSSVTVPAHTALTLGPPAFRYRGWFINDEDLLSGWKPGAADGTGISLETWDEIFEAILRLKGNMIVPGTFVFPDEPQVRAAGERGLVITQHHIEVLGTNTYRWPEHQPYSFTQHPPLLLAAWRNSMRQYAPGQEVIWTLGYRGKHDRPFWTDDPSAGSTDAERAKVIRRAIDQQVAMVRAERPGAYFLLNAWMEAVPFIRQGLLRIPEGVTLVWPDNGHGIIRDEGTIAKGQGVYYHTAMYNSRANQLTEMVPLERIQRELGRAATAGATEYLLTNTSDVRPVVMTTRAVMDLAWNAASWSEPAGNRPASYLESWCRQEFGGRAAPALARYYRAYFDAPGRYGPAEAETLADNAYHTFARHILIHRITGKSSVPLRYFPPMDDSRYAAIVAQAAREAEPRWKKARKLAKKAEPLVRADRRPFFQSHVLTQLAIHEYSNLMLREVAEGQVPLAIKHLEAVLAALQAAEYGKWVGYYRRELFTNVRHTLALARAYEAKLNGMPLPEGLVIEVRPADPYVELKAYQDTRRVPTQ